MCLNEKFLFEVYGSGEPTKTPEELAETAKRISEGISYYNKTATHPNGMYEILHQGNPYAGEEGETELIHSIQGAEVKYTPGQGNHFSVKVNWKNNRPETEIENIGICIHETDEEIKLGHIFSTTPWGIIKKNRTGVGATTLEINAERNSIIVVPTKTLAYTKYMTGWDEITGKNKYCYVGSEIGIFVESTKPEDIINYLNDPDVLFKKFLVVADSLPKVIGNIGDHVYQNYFLMVDEVDTYQDDSTFRPSLPNVIDYYFRFNPYHRCLVSATMKEFSHPEILREPVIELEYPSAIYPSVKLICGKNLTALVKEQIEILPTDEKIVIAFNKVQSILEIIKMLPAELQEECAILCSTYSADHAGRYHEEIIDNSLPKRINFITCTYFVGVDINERYHLISVSDVNFHYTVLSPEKLTQIRGRSRLTDGIVSETIFYNFRSNIDKDFNIPSIKKDYLEMSADMANYVNGLDDIAQKYPHLNTASFKNVKEAICEKATAKLGDTNTFLDLIRVNIDHKCVPNYLTIDALCESLYIIKTVYNSHENFVKLLQSIGYVIISQENRNIAETPEQKATRDEIQAFYDNEEKVAMEGIIRTLESHKNNGLLTKTTIDILYRNAPRDQKTFLDRFKALYQYVPFEELTERLKHIGLRKHSDFNEFYNNVIFYTLSDDHPFKKTMLTVFPENKTMPKSEMAQKVNGIFTHFLIDRPMMERTALYNLGLIFETKRTDSHKGIYKIVRHNKENFQWEPLQRIEASANLRPLIKITRKG